MSLGREGLIALKPFVDFALILGVVADTGLNQSVREPQVIGGRLGPLLVVAPNSNDLPYVGSANQRRAPARRPVSKGDPWMGSGANPLPEKSFGQCGRRCPTPVGLALEVELCCRIDAD